MSDMFLYSWFGTALIASGLALTALYDRRWTRLVRTVAVVFGIALLAHNRTFVVWDLVSAISFSVGLVMIIFLVLFAAWRLGFLDMDKDSPYRKMTDAELGITWQIRLKSWFRRW